MNKLSVDKLFPYDEDDVEFYDDCRDDYDWHHKEDGKNHSCEWVSGNTDTRCDEWFVKEGTIEPKKKAKDVCKRTCKTCSVPKSKSNPFFPKSLFTRPRDEWDLAAEYMIIIVCVSLFCLFLFIMYMKYGRSSTQVPTVDKVPTVYKEPTVPIQVPIKHLRPYVA